jgi:hypothetical protein
MRPACDGAFVAGKGGREDVGAARRSEANRRVRNADVQRWERRKWREREGGDVEGGGRLEINGANCRRAQGGGGEEAGVVRKRREGGGRGRKRAHEGVAGGNDAGGELKSQIMFIIISGF